MLCHAWRNIGYHPSATLVIQQASPIFLGIEPTLLTVAAMRGNPSATK